jgi:NADH-quinone oxidoreductase subunit D
MAEMWINMGPQHPMTHGLWNLMIKVDGEIITDAKPEIGYLHRGIEKICEYRDYNQVIPQMDRLCYVSSLTWAHAYCVAVEELMDIECPERGEYLRVIALELQRIASHLMWLGAYLSDIGLLTGLLYTLRERELALDLLQLQTGARMNQNYPRIGGVRNDIPSNFEKESIKALDFFDKKLDEYERLCDDSKIFRMRTQDVGVLSRADAINWGVTGPNLRGSNCDIDIRTHDPYSVYDKLDWEVAVEKDNDCYARYRVRMKEMRESSRMIRQALKDMPKGPFRVKPPRNAEGEAFRRTEDARGEALMYVIGDGTDKPYRLKIRSPIFVSVSIAPFILKGARIADVVSIMGSIDMCVGEMDK